jgi:AraC-like DNA-binding protein
MGHLHTQQAEISDLNKTERLIMSGVKIFEQANFKPAIIGFYLCKINKGVRNMSTLFIKNMVCNRCIMVVQNELDKLGLDVKNITLGEVTLDKEITAGEKNKLDKALIPLGFKVIDDKKSRIIEKIKNVIIDLVHHQDNEIKTNLSDVLSSKLHHDYNYLSNLFSEVEGTTIEKYFIAQKIEKVKELLVYDELSLSEIAFRLNYSSVAYLSNQFKKVTGLTPSHFKQIGKDKRKSLDEV